MSSVENCVGVRLLDLRIYTELDMGEGVLVGFARGTAGTCSSEARDEQLNGGVRACGVHRPQV